MDYKDALINSPFWVQYAYDEYEKLPIEIQKQTPFLYFLLGKGKGTPPFKMSKKDSDYHEVGKNPNYICGNCIFYYINPVKKIGVCSQIRGNVAFKAWCRLWVGKQSK
jgi:hypothetical protein